MSIEKMSNPGCGIGFALGVPTTVGIAATATYIPATGQYAMVGVTGVNISAITTSGGTTGTWVVLAAGSGTPFFFADGGAVQIVNTTTSVNVTLIQY